MAGDTIPLMAMRALEQEVERSHQEGDLQQTPEGGEGVSKVRGKECLGREQQVQGL
jgi:hypothetical protein